MYHLNNSPESLCNFHILWDIKVAFCLSPAFRALLQIRAVRKKPGALSPVSFSPVLAQSMDHDEHSVCHIYISVLSFYKTTRCHSLILNVLSPLSELRLRSPWLWAHLPAGGFERSWCRVPWHSFCTFVWWDQLLWEPERREPATQFTWPLWRQCRTEEQSQQVTRQVNPARCICGLYQALVLDTNNWIYQHARL